MNLQASPQYIPNNRGGYNLFAVDYVPEESTNEFYIILNPLGSECNVIDALLVNLARHLASIGKRVIRFDYYGTRDSDGDFSSITLDTLMSDVETICEFIGVENSPDSKLGFIGVRFGALLAMQFAETHRNLIDPLILCAPITSASDYFDSELMQALSMQTVLFKKIIWDRKRIIHELLEGNSTVVDGYNLANLNGYPLSKGLYQSVLKLDQLFLSELSFSHKCLIVNIDSKKRKVNKKIERLKEILTNASVDYVELIADQGLPWIHGKTLQKIYHPLNEDISAWVGSDD